MRLTIELTPHQEAQLCAAAKGQGLAPESLAQRLVIDHLPSVSLSLPDAENQALIDLLRSWREEDATDDQEELERRDRQNQELQANLEAARLTLRVPEI